MTPLDQVSVLASGGGKHTCALRAGKVLCWGANGSGQLGVDPATLVQRPNAVEVAGITDATAIGAADGITCAVRAGGSVWCWGSADTGQVGDAGAAFDGGVVSFTPVQIKGPGGIGNLSDVVTVAPGRRHVCARKVDNTVWCWGKNDRGQLGDGSKTDSTYPVKVTGLP
jgi:alpha-tubulin suppressor-like RCC1 family protein